MKKTVILSAPYMMTQRERFKRVLEEVYGLEVIIPEVKQKLREDDILKYAGQFDGILCGDDEFSARVIEACAPRLKVVSKWGTGIDAIDKAACARFGVVIGNTVNAFTVPVAESAIGYMLSFVRGLKAMDASMREGVWNKPPISTLSEATVGIIGVGNCGQAVARRLRGFGARILCNDIIEIRPDFMLETRAENVSLEKLLAESDIVTCHVDLNLTSYHLINAETLKRMKPTAILLNLSRGPVVDEPALIEALKAGTIAAAALDVFETEPLPASSELLTMDNVMLAPHNSNFSPIACERVHWSTIRNCVAALGFDASNIEELKKKY